MIPKAANGRALFGETWDRMYHYGGLLAAHGYEELAEAPNLFVRAYLLDYDNRILFHADLRGQKFVGRRDDPRPLFSWQTRHPLEPELTARMVRIEANRISAIPIRLNVERVDSDRDFAVRQCLKDLVLDRPEPLIVPQAPRSADVPRMSDPEPQEIGHVVPCAVCAEDADLGRDLCEVCDRNAVHRRCSFHKRMRVCSRKCSEEALEAFTHW